MKLRNKLSIVFALISTMVVAQQEQQYTQYMVNPYLINPAMGGTEDYIDIKLGGRYQWTGFTSAPRTAYVTAHSTAGKEFGNGHNHHMGEHKYWHGVGGYIYTDNTGPITRNTAMASYAYNMGITRHTRLSVGMFLGMKQFRVNGTQWDAYDPVSQDDVLIDNVITKNLPDASAGFWVYNKFFYFGGSVFQLLQTDIELQGIHENGRSPGKLFSHYFFTGGIRMPMSRELTLIPNLAVKGLYPAPVSVDLNVKADYSDKTFVGFSYRVGDAISVIAGVVLARQWEVSYSYDLTMSVIREYSFGTHELIVGYRLKHPGHIDCPSTYWK